MKKILISACIFAYSCSAQAISVEANQLKDKLAVFQQINASFVQKVSSVEGKLLNESTGEMTVSRPGKFHWQVKTPEEELIVSDGVTIWYYSPLIEQVTLINFADAIMNTPFALIAGTNEQQWASYVVTQKDNQFTVTNSTQPQTTSFIFEFDNSDNINKFVVIEEQGQRSEFNLTHHPKQKVVTDDFFNFKVPMGVEVDDQR